MKLAEMKKVFGEDCIWSSGDEVIICIGPDIMDDAYAFEDVQLPEGVEWAIAMGDDHPSAVVLKPGHKFDDSAEFQDYIVDFIENPEEEEYDEDEY